MFSDELCDCATTRLLQLSVLYREAGANVVWCAHGGGWCQVRVFGSVAAARHRLFGAVGARHDRLAQKAMLLL